MHKDKVISHGVTSMDKAVSMTESSLDLVLSGLWNGHTLSEARLPDGKDAMYLRYCLWMVTPSLSIQTLNSGEVRTSTLEVDWSVWIVA